MVLGLQEKQTPSSQKDGNKVLIWSIVIPGPQSFSQLAQNYPEQRPRAVQIQDAQECDEG